MQSILRKKTKKYRNKQQWGPVSQHPIHSQSQGIVATWPTGGLETAPKHRKSGNNGGGNGDSEMCANLHPDVLEFRPTVNAR